MNGNYNDSLITPRAQPYIQYASENPNTHPQPERSNQFRTLTGVNTVRIVEPKKQPKLLISTLESIDDPTSYASAMQRPDASRWKKAMEEELESFKKCEVWDIVDRPQNENVVTNRWVLRIKRKPNGEIERYRARLVARGFTQIKGIDYHETYSPVVNTTFIRILLALAARLSLIIAGFDIKTAFLHGDIEENVFMEQPEGFATDKSKVCKLKRSIYGLKQAPRCWNKRFLKCLTELDLTISESDNCVMYKKDLLLILAIYVDDGLIFSKSQAEINKVKAHLSRNFEIHEVGVNTFLGFQIDRTSNGSIFIHQQSYVEKVLKKFGFDDCTAVDSPLVMRDKERAISPVDKTLPYREAIGSLTYAATITRLDIACAVNRVARKVSNPTAEDWIDVKRIFRYLKGTADFGILYKNDIEDIVHVYVDADFAGCEESQPRGWLLCLREGRYIGEANASSLSPSLQQKLS